MLISLSLSLPLDVPLSLPIYLSCTHIMLLQFILIVITSECTQHPKSAFAEDCKLKLPKINIRTNTFSYLWITSILELHLSLCLSLFCLISFTPMYTTKILYAKNRFSSYEIISGFQGFLSCCHCLCSSQGYHLLLKINNNIAHIRTHAHRCTQTK